MKHSINKADHHRLVETEYVYETHFDFVLSQFMCVEVEPLFS